MFKSLKKQQFIVTSFLLLIILFLISFSLLNKESEKLASFRELKQKMQLAHFLSKTIHEIQKERGITAGYIASHGNLFKKRLDKQRLLTDRTIYLLYKYSPHLKENFFNKKQLVAIRKKTNSLSINVTQSIYLYSALNDKLLKKISNIAKIAKIPQITQSILAYSNFLYLKENAGIERAVGTAILSNKIFLKSKKIKFIKLIAMQEIYLHKFYTYASRNFIDYYKKTIQSNSSPILLSSRNNIIKAESYKDLKNTPKLWLKEMTLKINQLKKISNYIEKEIQSIIQKDYNKIFIRYISYLLITIILAIILIIISIVFLKGIHKERRKRLLLEKYVINSTTDLKGNITYVSEAFCKISGYTEKELIGKPHNIVRHPDVPKSTFAEIWKTIKNKKIWTGRIKNLKKNGDFYWVYATIEPLITAKGDIEGYAAVRIDITDSISLEEKIIKEVEKNREKDQAMLHQSKLAQMGEMISMIAHQWRQPLSAISATSGSLSLKSQIGTLDKETTLELANKITEYAQHLSTTIDDFRNFFKENKRKEETTFTEMITNTLNIVEISLKNANITVDLNSGPSVKIETYINEVKQVILNIIKNAEDILIDKAVINPKITIHINGTTLSISDNAGGVPKEIIEKIFDPYFSTKIQKDGTGLGLYMSKTIIEEHCGGTLTVDNTKEGAIFTITLPATKR